MYTLGLFWGSPKFFVFLMNDFCRIPILRFYLFHADDMIIQLVLKRIYDGLKSLPFVMAHKILNVFQKHDLRHGTVNDFRYVKNMVPFVTSRNPCFRPILLNA